MKQTNKSSNFTSWHGDTVRATINQLYSVLGNPEYLGTTDDKSQYDWVMETNNGDVFTVYDWKEYRFLNRDERIEWHIGGHNSNVTLQAQKELYSALSQLQ